MALAARACERLFSRNAAIDIDLIVHRGLVRNFIQKAQIRFIRGAGLDDAAGQPRQTGFCWRTAGVSYDSLLNIPHVIAAAGRLGKQKATLVALRSGAITSRVTDQPVARYLMGVG